ncbi:hypothetical protein MPP7335_01256 [Mycolicibacterium parafortuitum]|uniref:Uncharacterized protein n=3 Tax=Mycolicibacterium parafortuitum TaxID=39692 RepID=A0A375YEL1_MYCPF|nr:hypothetical protein [Mycolicibacterium parafortuitum]ORB30259.1 hypothetical protein BST38_11785 [Mycolicibacterium parafortuitum]SRX79519.1 hypothetical protein MPP7335_01256 [Mycolicibacterium parafortuitum]
MSMRTRTRSLLSKRVSVAGMIEFGLWMAIPYVVIGLAWAFFNVEKVRHVEDLLQTAFPAGGGIAAYLLMAGLWPLFVLVPSVCVP